MITLYQFPVSHYCEKVRWALDYKGLEYRQQNLLPGAHVKVVRKLAAESTVPVLVHDDTVVQNSSDIISYLDHTFPAQPLTPSDADEANKALAWERYVDEEIGPHLRRYLYWVLTDHPKTLIPLLSHGAPWYTGMMLRVIFPRLRTVIRSSMKINETSAGKSLQRVQQATEKLQQQLQDREYVIGNSFTRADLATCALLAPLYAPDKYGIPWPKNNPEPLHELMQRYRRELPWVKRMYDRHR